MITNLQKCFFLIVGSFLLLAFPTRLYAQEEYKSCTVVGEFDEMDGYIKMAHANIDMTDHYEIRVKNDSANYSLFYMKDSVFFKEEIADTSVILLPIEKYRTILVEGVRYELRSVATSYLPKKTFHYLFKIIDGKISLYEFDTPQTDEPNYYLFNGAKMDLVARDDFGKSMSDYFDENKDLSKRIKKGELGYKDIQDIVTEYNSSLN